MLEYQNFGMLESSFSQNPTAWCFLTRLSDDGENDANHDNDGHEDDDDDQDVDYDDYDDDD